MIAYLFNVEQRNVILTAELHNDSGPPVELFSSRKVNASEGKSTFNTKYIYPCWLANNFTHFVFMNLQAR